MENTLYYLDSCRKNRKLSIWNTPLDLKAKATIKDKFYGCIIGGAAGDALGYPVEFMDEEEIFTCHGKEGITEYRLQDGLARISDDTQMTLFTAAGLLLGTSRGYWRGIRAPYPVYLSVAYKLWYVTQNTSFSDYDSAKYSWAGIWLMDVPGMFARRAPGNTCLSAIAAGCSGRIEQPINHSKGCGGVMRVAPVGLFLGSSHIAGLAVDIIAADAAALTHGHEMGYIPAAMFSHIVRLVSHSDNIILADAVADSIYAMQLIFPWADSLPNFLNKIQLAIDLAGKSENDLDAIHALGAGWCGDEALAIAVYCALKYSDDFDKAIIAAVNHSGDSDSTGAITGNILGAYLGLSKIPEKYTRNLELMDTVSEAADHLFTGTTFFDY